MKDTKHMNGICQLCIAKIEMQSGVDPFDKEESTSLRVDREIDKNWRY